MGIFVEVLIMVFFRRKATGTNLNFMNMKTILLLLFCLPALAQTGFKADGNDIVWQKKFDSQNANIVAMLDRQPGLKVGGFMDNMYKGKGIEVQNTCDGGTGLMKNPLKFSFIILTDPYGYVVKIRDLKILEKYGPMQATTRANPAEKYFMDGDEVKNAGIAQQNMECLDAFLTDMFTPLPEAAENNALTSNK